MGAAGYRIEANRCHRSHDTTRAPLRSHGIFNLSLGPNDAPHDSKSLPRQQPPGMRSLAEMHVADDEGAPLAAKQLATDARKVSAGLLVGRSRRNVELVIPHAADDMRLKVFAAVFTARFSVEHADFAA